MVILIYIELNNSSLTYFKAIQAATSRGGHNLSLSLCIYIYIIDIIIISIITIISFFLYYYYYYYITLK